MSVLTEGFSSSARDVVVSHFSFDPLVGVTVVGLDGQVRMANRAAHEMFLGDASSGEGLVDQRLEAVFPRPWVDERMELFQQVTRSGQPILLRTIWLGRQLLSWLTPMTDDEGRPEVLIVTHHRGGFDVVRELSDDIEIVFSSVLELGELRILTARELEVLSLVGRAMTLKRIAERLDRSTKTVENHRNAMGQKLQITDRVKLAELAFTAGLHPSDAARKRVELPQRGSEPEDI